MRSRTLFLFLFLSVWAAAATPQLRAKTMVFAQAADGAGISLLISISNFSGKTATGTLISFNSTGLQQALPFSEGLSSLVALALPPNSTTILTTTGTSSPARTGYIQIDLDQDDVSAVEILRLGTVAEAAVLPAALGKAFGLFVEKSATVDTGIALYRSTALPVTLNLYTTQGDLFATTHYDFSGFQKAQSVAEIFSLPSTFRGILRFESQADFTGTGLRFGPGILAPLPFVAVNPASPAPLVTSVSPASAAQGQTVSNFTVTGTNFQPATTVSFSGSGVTVNSYVSRTATQIVANVSVSGTAAPGARNLTINNPDSQFTVANNVFTVNAAATPAITSITPTSGIQGQTLATFTVAGTNFQPDSTLTFSGSDISVNSYGSRTATQIVASITIGVSAATGTRNVTVSNSASQQAVLNNAFTVNEAGSAPTISGYTPTSGSVGLSILQFRVSGTNFQSASVLTFSGAGVTVVGYTTRTTLEIVAFITISDTAAGGQRTVTVTNPDGQQARLDGFTIEATKSAAQIQAERIYGNWTFNYDLSPRVSRYVFFLVYGGSSPSTSGSYFIGGLDPDGNAVVAIAASPTQYLALDSNNPDFDRVFVWAFTGADTGSGCYYQPAPTAPSLGTCYALTASRTPLTKWEQPAEANRGPSGDFPLFVAVEKLLHATERLSRRSAIVE